MNQQIGKSSVQFGNPPFLISAASIVGEKEGQGPLGDFFDQVIEDPYFGEKSWEMAEGKLMREAAQLAIKKANCVHEDIRYAFAGDLLEQGSATSYGMKELSLPLFGLFGACSTIGEALSLGAMTVSAGYADRVLATASSHMGSAEKQFRFPLGYGNQRPPSSTWTVTGAGAFVLGKKESKVKITAITTGRIVDYGGKDPMNMGASMAPAAAQVIVQHLKDFGREPSYYDAIYTGDLGEVGGELLHELLRKEGIDIAKVYGDCGQDIYDQALQHTQAGGSGCACSAVVLATKLLNKLISGTWKKILFIPTGALLSKLSFNEGETIAAIAHGIVLERGEC